MPFAWIYEKFFHKSFYEKNYRKRDTPKFSAFTDIELMNFKKIEQGGTILILYNDISDYSIFIKNFICETINESETIDYITTYRSPVKLCEAFSERDIPKITKRLSIIDCFSSHYAFDDKITKFAKNDYTQKGFKFYNASSFSEVHTATNDSWYRFRKVCESEENLYRIPHRIVYDTLSSLINFSSEELYLLFLRHVITSEKSYGMISMIIEPISLKAELINDLKRMADIVLLYDDNNNFSKIKS